MIWGDPYFRKPPYDHMMVMGVMVLQLWYDMIFYWDLVGFSWESTVIWWDSNREFHVIWQSWLSDEMGVIENGLHSVPPMCGHQMIGIRNGMLMINWWNFSMQVVIQWLTMPRSIGGLFRKGQSYNLPGYSTGLTRRTASHSIAF